MRTGARVAVVTKASGGEQTSLLVPFQMIVLPDDDTPKAPDPLLDDLASAQAKRALLQAFTESSRQTEEQLTLPVVVHG